MQNHTTRREFLSAAAVTGAMLAAPSLKHVVAQPQGGDSEERQKIEAAIPAKAFATPHKPRKLLIFDSNVGYGGHRSAKTANVALTLMGQRTGAFETVVSTDSAIFATTSLKQFDAVFFNNNVGNLFEDAALRQSLVEFVYGGGGLMGVHGTSVAFTKWPGAIEDWPEFGVMLGARGANHRASDEHVFIKLDDPTHPVTQMFSNQGFDYRDEFFRVHEPYSRNRVRVLLSIDTTKTDMNQGPAYGKLERPDNDYALAWVRQYGRGRAFYCGFAHNPSIFWDPKMLQFYLAATQFILGDLPAPTTPSAKLTPAVRAQEQLGWRLGFIPSVSAAETLFETIDEAASRGLLYVCGGSRQVTSRDIPKPFDGGLSAKEMEQVRLKLDAAAVRLLAYSVDRVPSDETACRGVFAFARKMGAEAVVMEPPVALLDVVEKLCDEYDIRLAMTIGDERRTPQEMLELCRDRGSRIGVCASIGPWMERGIDPVEGVRLLGHRLVVLHMGMGELTVTDGEKIGSLLSEVHRLGLRPTMFSVRRPSGPAGPTADADRLIERFNTTAIHLTDKGAQQ
jgi:type 1 glutamine amidotransferase